MCAVTKEPRKKMNAKPVKGESIKVKTPVNGKTAPIHGSNTKSTEKKVAEESNKPLPRYSDAKLEEFKQILEKREAKERVELNLINGYLSSNNEKGGLSEDGSAFGAEKENLNQQKARIITTLENIEKAYSRIRDKSYGRCKTTNELIDERRLRIHPWATQSIVAKMQTAK